MHITIVIHLEGLAMTTAKEPINSINAMIIEKNIKSINVDFTTQ